VDLVKNSLYVFVEMGILQAVVKLGPRHQHIAQVRYLQGSHIGRFLDDENAAKR
jgi:hypothetical protein